MKHWTIQIPLLGTVLAALCSHGSVARAQLSSTQRARSCIGTWTKPRVLKGESSHRAYVDSPELSQIGDELWAIGDPTLMSDAHERLVSLGEDSAWVAAGVHQKPGADASRLIRHPPGVREFIAPRTAASGQGLEVLWGGGSNPQRRGDPTVSEIWHARLDSSNWTGLERVVRVDALAWNDVMSSELIILRGELHVAAPLGVFPNASVLHLHSHHNAWRADTIARDEGATYAALGSTESLLFLVTVVHSDRLLLRRSDDGGLSWNAAQEIVRVTQSSLHAPKVSSPMTRATGERLFVLWAEAGNAGLPYERIRAAASSDDGSSWQLLPPLRTAPGLGFTVARIGEGRLAVASWVTGAEGRIDVAVWDGTRWRRSVSFAPAASQPAMIVLGDSLYLLWGVAPVHPGAAPHTRVALTSIRCAAARKSAAGSRGTSAPEAPREPATRPFPQPQGGNTWH